MRVSRIAVNKENAKIFRGAENFLADFAAEKVYIPNAVSKGTRAFMQLPDPGRKIEPRRAFPIPAAVAAVVIEGNLGKADVSVKAVNGRKKIVFGRGVDAESATLAAELTRDFRQAKAAALRKVAR